METAVQSKHLHGIHDPTIKIRAPIKTLKHNSGMLRGDKGQKIGANTDADQIIISQVGPHRPGELPPITYLSGGLETSHIRKAVCDILEGGERAFQERERRLRVSLER